jgi:guanylate kinase
MPEAVSVFLIPPSMEELERRLRNRGTDSEETIQKRLEIAKTEMALSEKYDYIVVNDDVDAAAGRIIKIINNEQECEVL